MIMSAIWNKEALVNISKTTNCTRPTGLYNFFVVFEKFTCPYLFQIALEII